ncbi:MAG TPA: hypothetical protein VJ840_03455 [Gemmatimonadaceae bacterium]|nr:hypothetical protein [Gemmatimonadaceae bacterium]
MRSVLGRVNLGFSVAVTVVVSGCASIRPYDPGPGKRVAAFFPKEIYRSGEPVNITIANLSEVALFYPNNFCKAKLQKMSGASWTTVSEPGGGCTVALGFLDPGQTVVHSFRLPQDVGKGIFRFAMPMPAPDDSVTVAEAEFVTPTFTVEDTPHR